MNDQQIDNSGEVDWRKLLEGALGITLSDLEFDVLGYRSGWAMPVLTQKHVAELMGISQPKVSIIETNLERRLQKELDRRDRWEREEAEVAELRREKIMTAQHNFEDIEDVSAFFSDQAERHHTSAQSERTQKGKEVKQAEAGVFNFCADVLNNSNLTNAKFLLTSDSIDDAKDSLEQAIATVDTVMGDLGSLLDHMKGQRDMLAEAEAEFNPEFEAELRTSLRDLAQQGKDEIIDRSE